MNRCSYFFITMVLVSFAPLLEGKSFKNRVITVINKTDANIGFITMDEPFTKARVAQRQIIGMGPDMQRIHLTRGRILGWHAVGGLKGFSVLDHDDAVIVLVKHKGEIKALHGQLKEIDVSNTRSNDVMVRTKNPNKGEEGCGVCAGECYDEDETLASCKCLNYCWDRTRDLQWRLRPGQTVRTLLAEGTKVGIFEEIEDDEEDYVCDGDVCDTTITITKTYVH